jgi:hypothetical protein
LDNCQYLTWLAPKSWSFIKPKLFKVSPTIENITRELQSFYLPQETTLYVLINFPLCGKAGWVSNNTSPWMHLSFTQSLTTQATFLTWKISIILCIWHNFFKKWDKCRLNTQTWQKSTVYTKPSVKRETVYRAFILR